MHNGQLLIFFILHSLIVNFATDPPEITDISSNQKKNEGDILTLSCTAYGDPTPNIKWTRLSDNSAVTFPLTISGKRDEGVYKCTADNGVGNAANRSVNVFVQSESEKFMILVYNSLPGNVQRVTDVDKLNNALTKILFSSIIVKYL